MGLGETWFCKINRALIILPVFLSFIALPQESWAQGGASSNDQQSLGFTSYPLRPPQLNSPQETIKSFLTNAKEAIERFRNEEPPDAVRRALRRAMLCLDLTEFPSATRESTGTEKVLLLKEILDRIGLPPLEEIPDLAAVTAEGLTTWTVPQTELTMTRVEEGPQAGAFIFTARTVDLLEHFYELAEFLPYKRGASVGAYEEYLYGPGTLIPRSWVDGLPSWFYLIIGNQTLWQWFGLAVVVAGARSSAGPIGSFSLMSVIASASVLPVFSAHSAW